MKIKKLYGKDIKKIASSENFIERYYAFRAIGAFGDIDSIGLLLNEVIKALIDNTEDGNIWSKYAALCSIENIMIKSKKLDFNEHINSITQYLDDENKSKHVIEKIIIGKCLQLINKFGNSESIKTIEKYTDFKTFDEDVLIVGNIRNIALMAKGNCEHR